MLGPLRKVTGSIARYTLTLVAVLMSPRTLHSTPPGPENPFLGDRAFVVGSIGLYQLLGGQFVYFAAIAQLTNPVAKTVAKTAASAVALLFLVGLLAPAFMVGARVAKTDLRLPIAARLASY
jgi:hypothetical protein